MQECVVYRRAQAEITNQAPGCPTIEEALQSDVVAGAGAATQYLAVFLVRENFKRSR